MIIKYYYPYFFTFLICGLFFCLPVHAVANNKDTITKKNAIIGNHLSAYNIEDDLIGFKDAFAAFRRDSIVKGIHLMAVLFRRYDVEKKISKVMDYHGLELNNFMNEIDKGKFTNDEKSWFINFVKAILKKKDEGYLKTLRIQLKALPQTLVVQRLKLFISTINDDDHPDKEADLILKNNANQISANVFFAEWLNNSKKYKESIGYCNKLINLYPDYAHVYDLRANNYAGLNESQKAIDDYDKAIEIFPSYYIFYYKRATAYIDLDKYPEAIPDLRKMFSFNPTYLWTKYDLAKSYKEIDKLDSALYFVNLHIEQYPDDGDGYDLKGDLYYKRDEYQVAIEQYNQAILTDSSKAFYYEDRADAYFYSIKYAEAITDFKKAISIDKNRYYAIDRLGECYYELKDYKKAIVCHKQAIKIKPDYKYAYVNLSMSKVELGDYNGAIADCKAAIAIDSTYDTAIGDLGWDYYCNNDYDNCIAYSYKAIKLKPAATYAMFNIALATLRQGKIEEAKTLYSKFITTCKEKGYVIQQGAVDDLKDIIKKKIAVDDCRFIIQHLFEKEL